MSGRQPFFSVIIPTFNSAATVGLAISSVFCQTFNSVELILVDGASTDDTLRLARDSVPELYKSQIKIISEPDQGIYDAMNKGVRNSAGDYLLFLGSDDSLFDSAVLENVFSILTLEPYKIVYGKIQAVNSRDDLLDGLVYGIEASRLSIYFNNIYHQSTLYHRSCFDELGLFDGTFRIQADWAFNLLCFAKFKPKFINIIIARYNVLGASSNNDKEFQRKKFSIYISAFSFNPFDERYSVFLWDYNNYYKQQLEQGNVVAGLLYQLVFHWHLRIKHIDKVKALPKNIFERIDRWRS